MAPKKKEEEGSTSSTISRILEKHKGILSLGEIDLKVVKVPTGIWTLDETLMGGIPMSKITEIHGGGGAGKTSLACLIGAAMQRAYPTKHVLYIDAESALDDFLAMEVYGLDPERTLIFRPDLDNTAEKLLEALLDCAMSPDFSCVILDSVAGLVTGGEMKLKPGESGSYAPLASLLGAQIKKLSSRQDPEAAAVLLLNQQRKDMQGFITTPGGSSVEFYPSLRLRLKRGEPVKETKDSPEVGFTCRCQVTKARYSRNRLITGWAVIYGEEGISTLRSIVTVAMEQGLIVQNASWFSIKGMEGKKWQGMTKMLDALRDDQELLDFVKDNLQTVYATEA